MSTSTGNPSARELFTVLLSEKGSSGNLDYTEARRFRRVLKDRDEVDDEFFSELISEVEKIGYPDGFDQASKIISILKPYCPDERWQDLEALCAEKKSKVNSGTARRYRVRREEMVGILRGCEDPFLAAALFLAWHGLTVADFWREETNFSQVEDGVVVIGKKITSGTATADRTISVDLSMLPAGFSFKVFRQVLSEHKPNVTSATLSEINQRKIKAPHLDQSFLTVRDALMSGKAHFLANGKTPEEGAVYFGIRSASAFQASVDNYLNLFTDS